MMAIHRKRNFSFAWLANREPGTILEVEIKLKAP